MRVQESLRVQEIMDSGYPFIYADELATKARAILREHGLRVLPVLDENKRLIGIIYRSDLMKITSSVSPLQVKGILSTPTFLATLNDDVVAVVRRMIRLDEWYIPVVKSTIDKTYMGVLGLEHFIRAYLKRNVTGLSKPLSSVMSKRIVTCSPDDEVDNVWRMMQEKSFAGLPVVKKERFVGIVTQKDFLESGAVFPVFEAGKGRFKRPPKISTVMKTSVVSLKPEDTVRKAAELMLEKNIGRIPITNNKHKLIGIVDREDVARALL